MWVFSLTIFRIFLFDGWLVSAGLLGTVATRRSSLSRRKFRHKCICRGAAATRHRTLPHRTGRPTSLRHTGRCASRSLQDRTGRHVEPWTGRCVAVQSVVGAGFRAFADAKRRWFAIAVGVQSSAGPLFTSLWSCEVSW